MLQLSRMALAQEPLPDMIVGDSDAPVEIIEYASMTCPHCAAFHTDTLPTIKERYIDTGKVKLVFREFPLDRMAVTTSAIARCAGEDQFFAVVDTLFRTQAQWSRAEGTLQDLKKVVETAGLEPTMVDTCLENQAIIEGILAVRLNGERNYDIHATPTFIINGDSYDGYMTVEEFEAVLAPYLEEG